MTDPNAPRRPTANRVTIRDVARVAGYSTTVVSHALNGQARISAVTREHIEKIAADLGYSPNLMARSLVTRHSQLVGLVVPGIITSFYPEIIESLKACLEPHGYGVMVMTSHDSRAGEVRATELLSQRKMDALIVAPCKGERDASRLDAIAETGTPVVMIDRWLPSRNCLSVATDNATGAELATRHLLELGHQRIGVVRARFACSSTRERLAGYRKALQSFGVKYDPDLVVSPNYNIGRDHYVEAGDLLSTLLSVPSPPTALFVFHDAIAVGVMSAAAKLHLRVPEDLSLVGYDDIEVVKYLPVPLTTIAQDKRALGQTAGDFVLRSLRGEAIAQRDVRLAPKLVVRQSTCRLAS